MFGNLQIGIPSRSRWDKQKTIFNLSQNLWPNIVIVVPESQYKDYREAIPIEIHIARCHESGTAPTRQFILDISPSGKVIMMDDDLTLYKRNDDGSKFYQITGVETEYMIADIAAMLDKYAMVGVTDKFMSQTKPRGFVECQRFNDIHGYNRDLLPDPRPTFRVSGEEEHDFHLQLLTRGHKTAVLTEYSKTNKAQAPGGCSDWRTTDYMLAAQAKMLELWPGIASLTPKPNYVTENRLRYNWRAAKQMGGLL